ncbi:MAG TPA: Stp1/IreP family PP2C-type Ser/Thr phosphatase, partial [Actinomycetota bacterium]
LATPPVYIVADGMGGHRGGNVASSLAMQVMAGLVNGGTWQSLADQVRQANHAILERSRGDRDLQGMGTTITATYVENGTVHLAQVGDSRAYLLRAGQFQQLTTDHTLVHEMVKRQQITPEEAEHHPQRSILTRALGVDEPVDVDMFDIPAQVGDRILLCSDGLHSMVDDSVIQQVLQTEPSPQAAADKLVTLANQAGGLDNITVIVLEFAEGEGFEGATWVPQAPADAGTTRETPIPTGLGADDVTAAYQIPPGVAAAQQPRTPAAGTAPPMPGPATAQPVPTADRWPGSAEPGRHRGGRRRTVLWIVGVIVLVAVVLVGFRVYLDSRFFVGVENGKVVVFRGLPTKTLGIKMFGQVEVTDIPADQALACSIWHQHLVDGDTAGSKAAADAIVAQIRSDLAPGGQCAPATGSGGGSSSSTPT